MNKNLKKLFIGSFSALNLLALAPNALCAPNTNPFSTSSTLSYIKESLGNYNFLNSTDFKDYISFNKSFNKYSINFEASKIIIERNGIITVLLVHSDGFKEEIYFSIPELSLSHTGQAASEFPWE